jgi:hypothetical protein
MKCPLQEHKQFLINEKQNFKDVDNTNNYINYLKKLKPQLKYRKQLLYYWWGELSQKDRESRGCYHIFLDAASLNGYFCDIIIDNILESDNYDAKFNILYMFITMISYFDRVEDFLNKETL